MKYVKKLQLLLESVPLAKWGDKGTWELIFGGYDYQDTYDLLPVTDNLFPKSVHYEGTFGHVLSLTSVAQLLKNQNKVSYPVSTFKVYKHTQHEPQSAGGFGSLAVLRGRAQFSSDTDVASIPDKRGQRRFVNVSHFTSSERYLNVNAFPVDFLTPEEDRVVEQYKDLSTSTKESVVEKYLSVADEVLSKLKTLRKSNGTYDEEDFRGYTDPLDRPQIVDFQTFLIVNRELKQTPLPDYSYKKWNKLKYEMVKEYFTVLKKESEQFWKGRESLLLKALVPKSSGFEADTFLGWNEVVVNNYSVLKLYVWDTLRLFRKKQEYKYLESAELQLETLSSLLKGPHKHVFVVQKQVLPEQVKPLRGAEKQRTLSNVVRLVDEVNVSGVVSSNFEDEVQRAYREVSTSELTLVSNT